MSDESNGNRRTTSLFIPTPWGKIEVRGLSTLMVIMAALMAVVAYELMAHDRNSVAFGKEVLGVLKEQAIAQREFSCLIAQPQEERTKFWDSGRCRRIAETGDSR